MKISYVYLLFCSLALIIANTVQDYLHAWFNDYTFYLSESLLFSCFWLLFPVIAVLQWKLQQTLKSKFHPVPITALTTILAIMSHFLLFAAMVTVISAAFFEHTYAFGQMLTYSVANMFWPCLLLYVISGIYVYKQNRTMDIVTPAVKKDVFLIKTGCKTITIKTEDIIFIKAESPYVALHTAGGKHLMLGTLSSIAEGINGNFVRIHKSTVVNMAKVTTRKSRGNGDYDLILENGDTIRMSRTYAADYKKLFSPQVAP